MQARDIMTKSIQSVESNATVAEIMRLIAGKMIRSVVVKPKDTHDMLGVVSVRDVVNKVLAKGLDPKKVAATDVATKPLFCVKGDMDVRHLMSLMQNYNIARVFVTDGGEIVGVVALMDFIKASVKGFEKR